MVALVDERSRLRRIAEVMLFAALYTAVAKLGLMMDAVSGFATLVWPATGLALVAVLRFGARMWPGIAIGALVVNLWSGAPPLVACGIALGNTGEALLGAWALRRFVGLRDAPERLSQAVGVVIFAALLSTLVSAGVGTLSLWLGGTIGSSQVVETLRAWWLGDAIGDLVVAPLLMAWSVAQPGSKSRARLPEAVALVAGLVAVSLLLFVRTSTGSAFAQVYLIFPVLIWAALRFGLRGATAATLLVSVISIWSTVTGHGPFVHARLATSLSFLQVFMGVVAVTALMLAVAIFERNQAVRSRDWLLAAVSHDLKSPLNAVKLNTLALAKRLPAGDAMGHKYVELLHRTSERMSALVRDLLDFEAIEAGQFSIQRAVTDSAALIEEAVELQRTTAASRSQTLVAAPGAGLEVSCDRERVLQVLANLIDNACKFSPDKSLITVRSDCVGGWVRISVADAGPGIAAEDVPHVFDPFWRRSGTRPGTGLGLAIVKAIVEAHGGRVSLESRVGAGTTFSFTLPAERRGEQEVVVGSPSSVVPRM